MIDQTLTKDLREAGFLSIADRVDTIHRSTSREGHERLAKAISILRGRRRYSLAERLDEVRVQVFGELVPGEDKLAKFKDAIQTALDEYCPNCDAAVCDSVIEFARKECQDSVPEEGKEKDGLGPGFEPGYVRAPQTVDMHSELPPTPIKEPT